jgi:hypothetical protein
MNQNFGVGRVMSKNIQINSLCAFEGLSAVKHGNGRDWWVIFKPDGNVNPPNNTFFSYLITPYGITNPIIDSVGSASYSGAGYTAFSKSGNRFALCTWNNLLEIFDFDRCTGHLSNPIIIEPENSSVPGEMRSVAFSPDGTRLYVVVNCVGGCFGGIGYLIQYDLLASNIRLSKDTLNTFVFPEQPMHIRLAPDDKIYLTTDYGNYYNYPDSIRNDTNENLSVINSPNNLGTACDFQAYSFYLGGKRTYNALPNNPDYEMEALGGSLCDSLGLPNSISNVQTAISKSELHVFFHTGWQVAFINVANLRGRNYSLKIFDSLGKIIFSEEGKLNSEFYTNNLNCTAFASGVYLVRLQTDREVLSKKFVKE